MMLPGGVAVNSVRFEMESWTGAQCAFAVKSFYKNDSYVAAEREFRKKFWVHRNNEVLSAHAIKTWINNFEETGSTVKKKGGSVKTVHTPQNVDAVRASFEQSPRRSAVRHSKKLGLSESSVKRILHLDLHCGYRKEISRIPVDVLRRAMSSVHDRLECEQRNGGHLEDVTSGMIFFSSSLCYVSRPLIHLFLQMLQYVLPYKLTVS